MTTLQQYRQLAWIADRSRDRGRSATLLVVMWLPWLGAGIGLGGSARRLLRSLPLYWDAIGGPRFGVRSARFGPMRPSNGESRPTGARASHSRAKWSYSKITNNNSMLRGKLDHGCVLFVQHSPEKASSQAVGSGSFVACAEVLGNCDDATEGGIPRSSR